MMLLPHVTTASGGAPRPSPRLIAGAGQLTIGGSPRNVWAAFPPCWVRQRSPQCPRHLPCGCLRLRQTFSTQKSATSDATISPLPCSPTARLRSAARGAKDRRGRRPRVVHPGTCHSRTLNSPTGSAYGQEGQVRLQRGSGTSTRVGSRVSEWCVYVGCPALAASRIGRLQIDGMYRNHSRITTRMSHVAYAVVSPRVQPLRGVRGAETRLHG